jgi:hypothetical protein
LLGLGLMAARYGGLRRLGRLRRAPSA